MTTHRLRDFVIGTVISPASSAYEVNLKMAPVAESIRWRLGHERVEAHFTKLFIDVSEDGGIAKNGPWVADRVAVASSPIQHSKIMAAGPVEARRLAADATRHALNLIAREMRWRDERLEQWLDEAAAHTGPYRLTVSRLTVSDRKAKRRYVPVIELDESGTKVVIECRMRDGVLITSRVALELEPSMYDAFLEATRARLINGQIEYLRRDGRSVVEVPRPDCQAPH